MTLFQVYPSYPKYRPLRLLDPLLVGEDVFGLQSALAGLGFPVGTLDGVFGKMTHGAVTQFQREHFLTVDGVAGPATQSTAVRSLAENETDDQRLPAGLLIGQLAHESSLFVGMYSPQRADGSYDAGVAQRNTAHTSARQGFNAPGSIEALALNTRLYYDKFAGVAGRRRWELAAGAWNAPAFACYIANEEGASVRKAETAKPGVTSREKIEAYMKAATAEMA